MLIQQKDGHEKQVVAHGNSVVIYSLPAGRRFKGTISFVQASSQVTLNGGPAAITAPVGTNVSLTVPIEVIGPLTFYPNSYNATIVGIETDV